MEATTGKKVDAPTLQTRGDNITAPASATADPEDRSECTGGASEDFLIFGARPANLFDDIAIAIDFLLIEEVASLPLLPRTLTESHRQKSDEGGRYVTPQTGEEKMLGHLRRAYQKNLDLAEAYCARNIFTVRYHPTTLRRKLLEKYLAQEREDGDATENKGGGNGHPAPTPLPSTTLPPPERELPSPAQITGMDKEILVARQRLQRAKRRRSQLQCQRDRLAKASQPLKGVQEALARRMGVDSNGKGEGMEAPVPTLKEMVAKAMEGHHDLRGWNSRAEEVLQILDKIKVERAEGNRPSGDAAGDGVKKLAGREADERKRKRMLAAVGGITTSYGSKEQVASLLKKLRGN